MLVWSGGGGEGVRCHSSWSGTSKFVDVLWLVRLFPDTSPEDVSQINVQLDTGLGILLAMGES